MGGKLRRFALPALVLVVTGLSVLIVVQSRSGVGNSTDQKPTPALGSPTLVFVVEPPADPQIVAVHLAGAGAVVFSYAQVCGMDNMRPPKFILPLAPGQAGAILARARTDPDVADPVLSVWPCGAGL